MVFSTHDLYQESYMRIVTINDVQYVTLFSSDGNLLTSCQQQNGLRYNLKINPIDFQVIGGFYSNSEVTEPLQPDDIMKHNFETSEYNAYKSEILGEYFINYIYSDSGE